MQVKLLQPMTETLLEAILTAAAMYTIKGVAAYLNEFLPNANVYHNNENKKITVSINNETYAVISE